VENLLGIVAEISRAKQGKALEAAISKVVNLS